MAVGPGDQYFSTVQSLIFGSPTGVVWSIRIATSAIIAVLASLYFVLAKKRADVQRASSQYHYFLIFIIYSIRYFVLLVAASIFSNSMLSHNSASTFLPSVAVFADWLHFMAVSAWVGGLFYFAAVLLFAIKSNERKSGESAPRLSPISHTSKVFINCNCIFGDNWGNWSLHGMDSSTNLGLSFLYSIWKQSDNQVICSRCQWLFLEHTTK